MPSTDIRRTGQQLARVAAMSGVLTFLAAGAVRAQERIAAQVTSVPNGALGWNVAPDGLTTESWASIRAAIDRDEFAIVRDGGVHRADNPAQQLRTTFTRDGVEVTPRGAHPAWRWGLEFAGYGDAAASPTAERFVTGNRVEYRRGEVVEWYVNDARGLEQGFTLLKRPARTAPDAPVVVRLRASGDLRPQLADDRLAVSWRDAHGATVLWYRDLKVVDASGRTLAAQIEKDDIGLRLRVDDRDARYPITIDPTILSGKLLPNDGSHDADFGDSVAISGNTVAVGVPSAGAVFIFERDSTDPSLWNQVGKVLEPDPTEHGGFGFSVAIDADTLIVGALGEVEERGAAYVFSRSNGDWVPVQKLLPDSDPGNHQLFGFSVSISGPTVIVGSSGRGSFYSEDPRIGEAYVFEHSGNAPWHRTAKLTASDALFGDQFGFSVSLSGHTAIVGKPYPVHARNGDSTPAAYVFLLTQDGTWQQVARLSDPIDIEENDSMFGFAVSIDGDSAAVGVPGWHQQVGLVRFYQRDEGGPNAWGEVAGRTNPHALEGDDVGRSVAISGDFAIADSGRGAFVFARDNGLPNEPWGLQDSLVNDAPPHSRTFFQVTAALDAGTAVIGAPSVIFEVSGAAYVCQIEPLPPINSACRRSRADDPVLNDHVTMTSVTTASSGATFTISATLTNISATAIRDPFFTVTQLTGGNLLQNADFGPAGVGATLTPDTLDFVLSPGESVTVTFAIGLATRNPFGFHVNVQGSPE